MPRYFATAPTDREIEVLRAYLETGSTKGAAHRLGVHPQTVKNQLSNVRRRLGVANTAQAVAVLGLRLK